MYVVWVTRPRSSTLPATVCIHDTQRGCTSPTSFSWIQLNTKAVMTGVIYFPRRLPLHIPVAIVEILSGGNSKTVKHETKSLFRTTPRLGPPLRLFQRSSLGQLLRNLMALHSFGFTSKNLLATHALTPAGHKRRSPSCERDFK